ncbi:MAG: hypothetical protein ACTSQE_15915 [Candidatus Heimdallarchaeaceae archaeon]
MPRIEDTNKPEEAKSPQSKGRQEVVDKVMGKINEFKENRKNEFKIIRNRSWTDYWDDSVKRFIQFKQRPAYKALWQSNTASNTPADKLIGILSQLAGQSMEAQVVATDDVSMLARIKERVLGALLKAAGRKNEDDYQLVLEMLAAMAKGTVIGYEGWRFDKTEIREITNQNPETGEMTLKKKTINKWNDVWGEIVPIENFYPGNIFVRPGKIQDMSDCAMRKIFKEDEWKLQFGSYPDADLVQTKNGMSVDSEDELFYKFAEDISDDEIEQWYYFNKDTDEMVIIANGIWINPMGVDTVQPLPWNHKKLPFWGGVFEPLAEDVFYGRSLPDKLITMVDMQDALFDRVLDQLALAVHKPILTRKNATSITKGFMHPGAVIQVKGSGAISNEFATLDVQEPSQAHIQMLQILEQRLDRTAITTETAAQGGGQRKTATQVLQEREAAIELSSLFLKLMEFAIRDKNMLRLPNMIQFYTLPINKKQKGFKFRKIILRDEKIPPRGELGTTEIQFTNQNIQEAQMEVERQAEGLPEPVDIVRISPSFIRDFEGEIQIIPATSVKQTESVRQAFELNFQQVMATLFPDKVNRDTAFEDMLRVFKKDTKRLKAETPAEQEDIGPETRGSLPQTAGAITQGLGGSLRQLAQR